MDLVDLFPKTIGVADLESLQPQLVNAAIELIRHGHVVEIPGDGGSTREQQLLNNAAFADVKSEILQLCREFASAHSHIVEDVHICNSWGNVVFKGDSIRYHRHSNAYISGVFFLTDGSPLNILNEDTAMLFGFSPEKRQEQNFRAMDSFSINPKPGRLVLFPSNLKHMVLPSDSVSPRYSIAFNAVPVGVIGTPTNRLEIRVPQ